MVLKYLSFRIVNRSNQKSAVTVAVCTVVLLIASSFFNILKGQDTNFFKQPYGHDYEIDMANRMKDGINIFLTDYTKQVVSERPKLWNRNLSSPAAYEVSVAPNRDHLRQIIGAIDHSK